MAVYSNCNSDQIKSGCVQQSTVSARWTQRSEKQTSSSWPPCVLSLADAFLAARSSGLCSDSPCMVVMYKSEMRDKVAKSGSRMSPERATQTIECTSTHSLRHTQRIENLQMVRPQEYQVAHAHQRLQRHGSGPLAHGLVKAHRELLTRWTRRGSPRQSEGFPVQEESTTVSVDCHTTGR